MRFTSVTHDLGNFSAIGVAFLPPCICEFNFRKNRDIVHGCDNDSSSDTKLLFLLYLFTLIRFPCGSARAVSEELGIQLWGGPAYPCLIRFEFHYDLYDLTQISVVYRNIGQIQRKKRKSSMHCIFLLFYGLLSSS